MNSVQKGIVCKQCYENFHNIEDTNLNTSLIKNDNNERNIIFTHQPKHKE
jgi:hypothetical protein